MLYPLTAACLVALLATPPITFSRAAVPSATTARRVMQFGDFGRVEDALILIRGALGPSSFFKDLRCVDSADKTLFVNDTGEALTFPDRLTITLLIIGPLPKNEYAQPKRLDSEYMLGLRFSANWKRGVKMRPVKAFGQLTASESQPPDLAVPLNVRQCWIYEFVVEDTDVPLTDHLILCIFSPENKLLARLSAHF